MKCGFGNQGNGVNLRSVFTAAAVLASFLPLCSRASVIAVLDSGSDLSHKDLAPQAWQNPEDDSALGYSGDSHGWNFVDNNSTLVDLSQLSKFSSDIYHFFDVQTRQLEGISSEDDLAWIKAHKSDPSFQAELNAFGDFAHGTNVAGIAARDSQDARIMSLKMIGSGSAVMDLQVFGLNFFQSASASASQDQQIRAMLDKFVSSDSQEDGVNTQVGKFLNMHPARVANCSFGSSAIQIKKVVDAAIEQAGVSPQAGSNEQTYFDYIAAKMMSIESSELIQAVPQTLFVIASGNDGANNDVDYAIPADIKLDNTITVAASYGRVALAAFSNYGAKMVEVAAPGVGIYSESPGNLYVRMSGTSQATPYVSNAAGRIFDENPALTPGQTKQILIGTVDVKDFLAGKVSTSGIVNPERAMYAAKLTLTMSVDDAIAASKKTVSDLYTDLDYPDTADSDTIIPPLRSEFLPNFVN